MSCLLKTDLNYSISRIVILLTLTVFTYISLTPAVTAKPLQSWGSWGQNISNTHHNPNSGITKGNLQKIVNLCKIDYTHGHGFTQDSVDNSPKAFSTSSKPIIIEDIIYWTAFAGKIGAHKIERQTNGEIRGCKALWAKDVSDLLGLLQNGAPILGAEPSVRSSPVYYERTNGEGTLLYTAVDSLFSLPFSMWFSTPPMAFALDAKTGDKLWQINLVTPGSVLPGGDAVASSTTGSPRVHENIAYIGIASLNNALSFLPLTFRGHMIALELDGHGPDRTQPAIKWVQYTVPPRPPEYPAGTWFAGGGVWASAPSIIPESGLVIFGSGQLYNYPDFAAECMGRNELVTTPTFITTKKGETGKGAQECLIEAEAKLKQMGITHPLATNSIIALNMADGSFAWHVPTAGLDSWQAACGVNLNISCNVPVPGPDWDVSGSSPMVVDLKKEGKMVIGHNKGGSLYWIKAANGKLFRKADVCVGSALGGIHWGLSYDPDSQTIYASCSAGQIAPTFGANTHFLSILANGRKTCKAGYLNAIDAASGQLKWQTLPASAEIADAGTGDCTEQFYEVDERFKYGLNFDVILKNKQFSNARVNVMPNSSSIPLAGQGKGRSNGVPANANGIVYWPVYYGTVYALNAKTGAYLNEMHCDQGAMYAAGPSVANGVVAFGCGYGFAGQLPDIGKSVMIYGLPKFSLND